MDEIIQKEREAAYRLQDKELFARYTLILINQNEARKRHKRNLVLSILAVVVTGLFLPQMVTSFYDANALLFTKIFNPLQHNPLILYISSQGTG